MIMTPRNKKMFRIVGGICLAYALIVSVAAGFPGNPIFILANMLANGFMLAPFMVSYVRENGYHWICLALPIVFVFAGGFIAGLNDLNVVDGTRFFMSVGVFGWAAAAVLSLIPTKEKV